ncbi:MAG: methyl-accepting chemotaxis protein [Zoogloeaceae bacterium]|jgi:methyl-accepting chemotaxis protein|nr:methyl-accepting chemotaxis protein [Zoogloeaceae bacterium]
MKISFRISLLTWLSLGALAFVGVLGWYNTRNSTNAVEGLDTDTIPKLEAVLQFRVQVNNMVRRMYEAGSKNSFPYDEQIKELTRSLSRMKDADTEAQKWYKTYDEYKKFPEAQKVWEDIRPIWPAWSRNLGADLIRALEDALNSPTPEKLNAFYARVDQTGLANRDATSTMGAKLIELVEVNDKVRHELIQKFENHAEVSMWIQIGVTVVSVLTIFYLGRASRKAIVVPVEQVRDTVQRVERENDLRLTVDYRSDDEVGQMVTAFNAMMKRLQASFTDIQKRVRDVNGAVESLNTAAQQVATSSASQSSSTSAMAASVEEMTVSINTVASSAGDAQAMAQHAGEVSDEGGQIIERTAGEMGAIAETVAQASGVIQALGNDSQQISSVVQVIKEVADQTNLLALNAAIAGARAGEQGRGFAVVADEVRKLAERTAQSTGDISKMIGKIQESAKEAVEEMERVVKQVESGQTLAQHAGERMAEIREEANKVSEAVTEISNALKEQSQASQDIARHVESIAQMTDENNAAAEETASGAQRLNHLADEVSKTLGQFKV